MDKIGIIGAGFVGSACEIGFQSIANIKIYDKYKNTESLEAVLEHSKILFLCLPTPTNFETQECDISIIENVCKEINEQSEKSKIIIIKSTVPPGTTDKLQELYPNHVFLHNPEFLKEKTFIEDFQNQNRVILGWSEGFNKNFSLHTFNTVNKFYKKFTEHQRTYHQVPAIIINTMAKISEMSKYTINCFLATKISYFNEVFEICERAGIDYNEVKDLVLHDSRITPYGTRVPGEDGQKGFSLSCLPKDINGLISYAKSIDIDPIVLESVWTKNLLVRDKHDWEALPQFNGQYEKLLK
jgi:UDPglucose 6-dehydrogenase